MSKTVKKGLVQAKGFTPKKRRSSFQKAIKQSGFSNIEIGKIVPPKFITGLVRILIIGFLVFIAVFVVFKNTILSSNNTIQRVNYSAETLETFDDLTLFNLISSETKGKSYFILKTFNSSKLLHKIQESFPFVSDIQLQREGSASQTGTITSGGGENIPLSGENQSGNAIPTFTGTETTSSGEQTIGSGMQTLQTGSNESGNNQTGSKTLQSLKGKIPTGTGSNTESVGNALGVHLTFQDPILIVKLGDKKFGVRDEETIFPIPQDSSLGEQAFLVETPQYLSGVENIDGLFFQVPFKDFITLSEKVTETIPNSTRFVYLVGSPRFAIFTDDGKTIYINAQDMSTIDSQLQKYKWLQKNYQNFKNLELIDLGSLDAYKVIVKK